MDNIGCGSCIGGRACDYVHEEAIIGENSCVGSMSCTDLAGKKEFTQNLFSRSHAGELKRLEVPLNDFSRK